MPFRVQLPPWREHPSLLLRSPMVWALLGVILVFTIFASVIEREPFILIAQALRLVFSTAVFFAYLPAAYHVCLQRRPERWGYLTLGICGSWGAEAAFGLRGVWFRLAGRPSEWSNALDIPFLIVLSGMFAVMHLTAGAIKEGDRTVPTKQWIYVAIGLAIGTALGGALGIVAKLEHWVSFGSAIG